MLGHMKTLQLQFLMLIFAGWVNRSQHEVIEYLQEENRVLREQLGGKRILFTDRQRRRLAAKAKAIGRKGLFEITTLVTPDTLLRWYRRLIAKKYDGSRTRSPGRPKTASEIEGLIVRMARDNPRWGYTRIRGALHNLGHEIGRNTIKRILLESGFDPARFRSRGMSWKTFLIDLETRRVEITRQPDGEWMKQIARNLNDVDEGFLNGTRYLIRDCDSLFTEAFRDVLRPSGVRTVKLLAAPT